MQKEKLWLRILRFILLCMPQLLSIRLKIVTGIFKKKKINSRPGENVLYLPTVRLDGH